MRQGSRQRAGRSQGALSSSGFWQPLDPLERNHGYPVVRGQQGDGRAAQNQARVPSIGAGGRDSGRLVSKFPAGRHHRCLGQPYRVLALLSLAIPLF